MTFRDPSVVEIYNLFLSKQDILNDLKLKGYLASKSEVYDRYSKQFKDVGLSIIEAENNEKLYNLAELFLKNSSIIKSCWNN